MQPQQQYAMDAPTAALGQRMQIVGFILISVPSLSAGSSGGA